MTRYEELQEELKAEGQRMIQQLIARVADGDFAHLDGVFGVLIHDQFSARPSINFCPFLLGGMDTGNVNQVPYSTTIEPKHLPKLKVYTGYEEKQSKLQEYINEKIDEAGRIPF